jgi:hypothetical protein
MGKWVFIPWIGGQNTMVRGRYTMGRGVKVAWMGRGVKIPLIGGVKIPWVWGSIYHGEVVKIPWVVVSKYYG